MHVGDGRGVEPRVLRTPIDGIGRGGRVFRDTQQHKLIHCHGGGCPVKQHPGFSATFRVAFRGREGGDSGRLVAIERRAIQWNRSQIDRVIDAQVGLGLVDARGIGVMHTPRVGDVGDMCQP